MVTEKSKENLKLARKLTTDEARKIGKAGGEKRAENIAKRKTLKEDLLAMLEIKQQNNKTIQENWMTALAKQLLAGNIKASVFVRDTIGEKPVEKVETKMTGDDCIVRIVKNDN